MTSPQGRDLAMETIPGTGPGVIFLGGFRSDMEGSKALYLRDWCTQRGRAFTRFDYSGHGASGGRFEDGAIGDWFEDACAVLGGLTGPQVLVGSSMGGWIALLIARALPERVAGLVTIAAAPDFTVAMLSREMTAAQRATWETDGQVALPSDYGDPYIITRRLIDEAQGRLVMDQPLALPFPVRMLQGTADVDVLQSVATDLLAHATGPDIRLTLVKGADHRFSEPAYLALIGSAVTEVVADLS